MPREIRFFECSVCGKQFDAYSEAESHEWEHEFEDAA